MTPLQGKIALVTGGARGIGAAAASLLAERGAKVVVNYVNQEGAAQSVVAKIREGGGEATAIRADVRDDKQVEWLTKQVEEAFGPVDILVSNANMAFAMKPIMDMTWDEFSGKLNDEMKAAFSLTRTVVPAMINRKYGRLIYVSSTAADSATPYMSAHGSAKAALNSFVKYAALELGSYGITANIVSPGLVETDASRYTPEPVKQQIVRHTPLQRIAQPDDISGAIAFLASDDARYITGTRTVVSGGLLMT